MITEPRNVFIKDVTLNYAKLVKPVNPFGTEQYELQIATESKAKAKEMSDLGLNVKEKDGKFTASLKRKAFRADGSANGRPQVFDAQVQELSEDVVAKLGNGSVGNVKLYQYPYEAAGRKGVAASLTAVQVVDFIEYTGSTNAGFDVIGEPTIIENEAPFDSDDMPF